MLILTLREVASLEMNSFKTDSVNSDSLLKIASSFLQTNRLRTKTSESRQRPVRADESGANKSRLKEQHSCICGSPFVLIGEKKKKNQSQ
jgi:hypothetical protein